MSDLSGCLLAGEPVPGVIPPPEAWLPPEAPMAMPLQILERRRRGVAALLADILSAPHRPETA
jgi:hypothetical protein